MAIHKIALIVPVAVEYDPATSEVQEYYIGRPRVSGIELSDTLRAGIYLDLAIHLTKDALENAYNFDGETGRALHDYVTNSVANIDQVSFSVIPEDEIDI